MKKHIRNILFFAALIFAGSIAASNASAQITGGYGDASRSSKEVREAATFAVKAHAKKIGKAVKLVRIEKAETQVVAGLNYRICMDVREGKGKQKRITAVIYRDLKQHLSLTTWKSGGCQEL